MPSSFGSVLNDCFVGVEGVEGFTVFFERQKSQRFLREVFWLKRRGAGG